MVAREFIAFPWRVAANGVALVDYADHVEQLIGELLFMSPGERVNRPGLGCGLAHLVFGPAGSEVATATQYLVQGSLQKWLGDLIQVDDVTVAVSSSEPQGTSDELVVTIVYTLRLTGQQVRAEFQGGLGG